MRVLVVDDASFMRLMLKDILAKHGYDVVGEAATGQQAIALFEQLSPDIVTLDITMPDMDGLEALKGMMRIRPTARVVVVSALGQHGLVVDVLRAGALDFVVKPFQADRLLEAVRKASRA